MLQVKIKTKDIKFSIPVPYTMLNIAVSVLTSKLMHRLMNKWMKDHIQENERFFFFPQIDKKVLKPVVHELKKHKGHVLVDVIAKDGTEVYVRL